MNRSAKGRSFEYKVRSLFEGAGYSCVRAAASKGEFLNEKVDLVCSKQTRQNGFTAQLIIVGVQAKVRRNGKI